MAFVKDAITILGKGQRPDSHHILKLPLPDTFLLGLLGPMDGPNHLDRCALVAFLEGYLGQVQFYSPFHAPRDRKADAEKFNRERPNTLRSHDTLYNPYARDTDGSLVPHKEPLGFRGMILERRGIVRLLALLNLLGFFHSVPRFRTLSHRLLRSDYPDALIPKSPCHGARTMCLSSLILDFPFVLHSGGKFLIDRILGSGSEKTVFQITRRIRPRSGDPEAGLEGEQRSELSKRLEDSGIAVRCNTTPTEYHLTRTCADASSQGSCINHYLGRHLLAPLMTNADDVLQSKNSVLELLHFIRSACQQLQALNRADYIHRDIKLGNIMATSGEGTSTWYLLCDYGHASKLGTVVTCSSRSFADPCHLHCPATPKMDVWCIALSVLKYITSMANREAGQMPVLERIREWYRIFLSQKEEFKKSRHKPNGSWDNPHYREMLKDWNRWWDEHIWYRLIPHFAEYFGDTSEYDSFEHEDTISGGGLTAEILYPLHRMNAERLHPEGLFLLGRDLCIALRRCMEIADVDERWEAGQFAEWADFWLAQLNDPTSGAESYFS